MMQKALKNHAIPYLTLPELTEEFQISEDSIRAFEQTGLIHAGHKENGIPSYSEFQRARLRFIIYCNSLGYSAADIVK
ncbi:MAG: MerR family transcriptional regulator, partial [Desulfobacterales bacterium]